MRRVKILDDVTNRMDIVAVEFRQHHGGNEFMLTLPPKLALKRIAQGNGYGLHKVVFANGTKSWATWKYFDHSKRLKTTNTVVIASVSGSYLLSASFDIIQDWDY